MTHPIPFIPDHAPFTAEQRAWLNGYLAGFFSDAGTASQPSETPGAPAKPLTILYGSQTGTAEGLAKRTAKAAEARGFLPKLVCMDKYESANLPAAENVLVITSTYGDGEPPDNAQSFWSYLSGESAPRLERTHFSVLALGDTNYPAFCQFGKLCDERFEQLGAQRLHPRVECDVDYDAPAKSWVEGVFTALTANGQVNGAVAAIQEPAPTHPDRRNPYPARLLTNRLLTGAASGKEVRHFEIGLANSGLSYEVGDALGVMPTNCPQFVNELLEVLHCDGEEAVPAPNGSETSLRLALVQHYDITRPSPDFLKAASARHAELAVLLDPARKDELKSFLWGREIIDLLTAMSPPFTAPEFIGLLKKLQPRLYSISSSPKAHPGEVHLTVGAVRYVSHGRARKGVASTFLADRVGTETPVPVFVQVSHGFGLPANGDTAVIMCGPGTGIAPFRAFLEEREAVGAKGRNWLLFGDQRRTTDFLYQEQLEAWVSSGHLARLDLAFSRDQSEKVYVQHRMLEHAAELWVWLQDGAHFYVCGDASRMAKDVDAALHKVAERAGGLSPDAAAEYVARLKLEKRYQRDVY
jgi:sulfite reductase (NADPH) flavoprotein alpha-component